MATASRASLTPRQLALLVGLTLVWGINWPIMKMGIRELPPLTFRMVSMWLAIPVLAWAMRLLQVPLRIRRSDWRELGSLTLTNMLVWHVVVILSLQALSSGRAAILGYTMPVFSALWGMALFGQRLTPRQLAGVAAAGVAVALLLWHELSTLSGRPAGAFAMLAAAAVWAFGTHQLRRTRMTAPTLAIAFWMTVATTLAISLMAVVIEGSRWHWPGLAGWAALVFNGAAVLGFAQPAWLSLARDLPPIASTLSVMMIPVLGVACGALWLGEVLHWQDGAAVALIMAGIASVLWPQRA